MVMENGDWRLVLAWIILDNSIKNMVNMWTATNFYLSRYQFFGKREKICKLVPIFILCELSPIYKLPPQIFMNQKGD